MEQIKQHPYVSIALISALFIGGIFFIQNNANDVGGDISKTEEAGLDSKEENSDAIASLEKNTANPKTNETKVSFAPSVASAPTPLTGKPAPEFQLPSGFSNTEAFKLQDIVGKRVIILSFQNYTTQNSFRSERYLNLWHEKYKNKGLSVITVHTPRFTFDRSKSVVDQAAFAHQIYHPIVLDNEFATAKAWGVGEWPTMFLVDINGRIASSYKGEGNYQSIEAKIQQLLTARETKLKLPAGFNALPIETPSGVESIDFAKVKSPETFFGYARNAFLGNGTKSLPGMQDLKPVTAIVQNTLYLTGSWEFTSDYAKSSIEQNKIIYRYNAKNVYAVFGSLKMNKVFITLDGEALGVRGGKDVREEKGRSYIFVSEERIYDIVKGDAYGEHTLEMVAETSGLEAYVLQFS